MSDAEMGTRVFCGNLAWKVDDAQLREHMSTCGTVVEAKVAYNPDGRSKGWGIVEFQWPHEARKAVESMHDSDLGGRPLTVREDRKPVGGVPSGSPDGGDQINLFVGNLPWSTGWEELKDAFSEYGVEYADVKYGRDGRSRGYGIVRVANAEMAAAAIERMNGFEMDGRSIEVREDRGPGRAAPTGGAGGGGGGGAPPRSAPTGEGAGRSLFVGNLPWSVDWQQLKDVFADFDVEFAEVKVGRDGRSRGYGIVRMTTEDDAQRAITAMNGIEMEGRSMEVRFDRSA